MAWGNVTEEAQESARMLSYDDVVREVLAANPDLVAAGHAQSAAEGLLEAAKGRFDPSVGVQAQMQHINTTGYFQGVPFKSLTNAWDVGTGVSGLLPMGTSYALTTGMDRNRSAYVTDFGLLAGEQLQDAFTSRVGLSVTQNLLRGYSRAYNLKDVSNAERVVGKAELRAEQARQLMVSATAEAYWDWAYQYALLEIRRDTVRSAEEQVRVAELRVAGDAMPLAEMNRLQSALMEARALALEVQNNLASEADRTLLLMGRAPGEKVAPATRLVPAQAMTLDVEKVMKDTLAGNLELRLADWEVDHARWGKSYAEHDLLPEVSTTVTTGVLGQQDSAAAALGSMFTDSYPYVTVMGNVTVPLGNRVAKGNAEAAASGFEVAKLRKDKTERSIKSRVYKQVRSVETSADRLAWADAKLGFTDSTLSAEKALYAAGRTTLRDLLFDRAAYDQARAEVLRARAAYWKAETELRRLQGRLAASAP
jgi:outer membrane protein TolC